MRKWLYAFLSMIMPVLAFAADPNAGSALSFAPPAGDYSVAFLGNIFGLVDGVLHGTGSQIMGNMFGIFNSAVLALGGIIITYTLMVSTMNTAQEGQFLGQKWSSIWIPVRSTLGLALIIPKASGYCLMQIFVMWVAVQGIGAADKVWDSALSYLNRGGVIIKAQQGSPITKAGEENPTLDGAYKMLVGQVCMISLENQLKDTREGYLHAAPLKLGTNCDPDVIKKNPESDMAKFCNTAVPSFVSSVNFLGAQEGPPPYKVKMPNFPADNPYSALNGICGTIQWKRFGDLDNIPCKVGDVAKPGSPTPQNGCGLLSSAESEAVAKARPIALTAMYNDLASIALIIANNIPTPDKNDGNGMTRIKKPPFSLVAQEQFGVPFTSSGRPCEKYADNCVGWGAVAGGSGTPLFSSGAEFIYAVLDYNGVMLPNLNLLQQLKDVNNAGKSREFIAKANREGWIMAGAYFFDLVRLNGDASSNVGLIDTDSGLDASIPMKAADLTAAFTDTGCSQSDYSILCTWLKSSAKINPVLGIINGTGYLATVKPPVFSIGDTPAVGGKESSTVNGYVQNSAFIQLPGQPGIKKVDLKPAGAFTIRSPSIDVLLNEYPFDCGALCNALGNAFWNGLVLHLYWFFLEMIGPLIIQVVNAFIVVPLQTMSYIFLDGLNILDTPGMNPVIALANMGVHYINTAGNMWINMLMLSITTSIIPFIGKFIFALITLSMPIVIAWLGVMMGVGFITAYYIPVLPFLIFTFASIGWLIAVIEAMVAAPIVALGVTHPEGHDAFGKGEQAVMILMNVFLRPAMMIIGYVAAIALCYVGVWLLNAGFQHAIGFVTGIPSDTTNALIPLTPGANPADANCFSGGGGVVNSGGLPACTGVPATSPSSPDSGSGTINYGYGASWAGIYAFFFAILIYTSAYLTIVQKAFTLIHYLPDKVLRWIGGQPEGIGGETAGWADETKGQIKESGDKTGAAQGKIGEKLGGSFEKGMDKLKENAKAVATAGSGGVAAEPSKPEEDK